MGRQLAEVARNTAAEMADLLNRERRNVDAWAHQDVMRGIPFGDADKRIAHLLMSIKQSNAGYLDLVCTDAGGRVVATTNAAVLDAMQGEAPWSRTVRSGKEFLAGPVAIGAGGRSVLEIAAPVYDPENPQAVIGGLLGLYDWNRGTVLGGTHPPEFRGLEADRRRARP